MPSVSVDTTTVGVPRTTAAASVACFAATDREVGRAALRRDREVAAGIDLDVIGGAIAVDVGGELCERRGVRSRGQDREDEDASHGVDHSADTVASP